jgi:hypothetical protein
MSVVRTYIQTSNWNHITPRRLLIVAWVVVFLFSEWFYPKGWPVVIVAMTVASATLYLLLRFVLAIFFRCPFQYSILSLLAFTALIAATLGWVKRDLQEAARQERALGPLCMGKCGELDSPVPAPAWLCALLGNDFFWDATHKTMFDFSDESGATDADLEFLNGIKNVRVLHLRSPKITDAGIKKLRDFKQLLTLDIRNINVRDAGLEQLKGLENLQELSLVNTRVTGAGLKCLKLDRLRHFSLEGTNIADDGWEIIKGLDQLDELSLRSSGATDARLGFLAKFKNLRLLDLSENPATDASLSFLKESEQLQILIISKTNVTDAGLEFVKNLKNLKHLSLADTEVTYSGVSELNKSLPNCKID